MLGKEPVDLVYVDPDFAVALLLTLVKNQLHSKMEMIYVNVVGVFGVRVPGAAQEADQIPGVDGLPLDRKSVV